MSYYPPPAYYYPPQGYYPPAAAPAAPADANKGLPKWAIVLLVVLGLLVIGGVAFASSTAIGGIGGTGTGTSTSTIVISPPSGKDVTLGEYRISSPSSPALFMFAPSAESSGDIVMSANTPRQTWRLVDLGGGKSRIFNMNRNRYLSVDAADVVGLTPNTTNSETFELTYNESVDQQTALFVTIKTAHGKWLRIAENTHIVSGSATSVQGASLFVQNNA